MPAPVYLLPSPHAAVQPYDGAEPPLGSVLVVDLSAERTAYRAATTHARSPWCPVAALVRMPVQDPVVLSGIRGLGPHVALVPCHDHDVTAVGPILAAVRTRPRPSTANLVDYVTTRLGIPELADALVSSIDADGEDRLSRSAVSRRLRPTAPLTGRDWAAIATLAAFLGRGNGTASPGVSPRTLSAWCRRFLGLPIDAAQQVPGWEWVLEAAMRRAGLVQGWSPDSRSHAP